ARLESAAAAAAAGRRKKAERAERARMSIYGEMYVDWDDNFAYIAGFTSWGFPYGITWEEMKQIEIEDAEALEPFGLTRVAAYEGEQDDYDDEYIDEEIYAYPDDIPF